MSDYDVTEAEKLSVPGGDEPCLETSPKGDCPETTPKGDCPELSPRQLGFKLEDLIHSGLKNLDTTLKCLRENEIRKQYKTRSLFGIDHFITKGNYNIFIQDKWCETSSQNMDQVNQFIVGTIRLKKLLNSQNQDIYIWVAKEKPGTYALDVLNDFNVELIICNTSIEALAQLVINNIAKKLNLGSADVKIQQVEKQEQIVPVSQPTYSESNLRLLCEGLLHGKRISKRAITQLAGYSGKNAKRDFNKITTQHHWTTMVAALTPEEIKQWITIGNK